MDIRFERLFEVEIFHQYYTSGISRDFDITPTARCRSQLRNYGLLFKKTAKGFVLLYEVVKDRDGHLHPLKSLAEDIKFSFTLQSKNPYVLNYSELPLDNQPAQIYYLHNLNNNTQDGKLLLSSDPATAFLSGSDRIELRSPFFQYSFESMQSAAEIEVLDEFSTSVLKKTVPIIEGVFTYPVDLRSYPPGKFLLKIDGSPKIVFYADHELVGKNIFGIIDVFRNDKVPTAYQFTDDTHNVVPKTYTIKLNNRKTFWKYYVVPKYESGITSDNLSIFTSDASITFSHDLAATLTLSGGITAIPFISGTEVALQEKPIKGIHLQLTHNNGNGVRNIENLSNPSVTTIKPDVSDGKIYSEIFIYV